MTPTDLQILTCMLLIIYFKLFRNLLAYIFIPVVQKELDFFRETVWNSHRIRKQKDARLPKGIPDHVFNFPEKYEAEQCGMLEKTDT